MQALFGRRTYKLYGHIETDVAVIAIREVCENYKIEPVKVFAECVTKSKIITALEHIETTKFNAAFMSGVVYYFYDAFRNVLESIDNRTLYTGQQYDQETGQYYLRERYYNPVAGRFLQEDTYCGDGLNLYAYYAKNPVMYYDLSGHDDVKVCTPSDQAEPDKQRVAEIESGSGSVIHNDVLNSPRTGSVLKVDDVSPIYEINERTGRPQIVKEFPASAQAVIPATAGIPSQILTVAMIHQGTNITMTMTCT